MLESRISRRIKYVENDFYGDAFHIDVLKELSGGESIHIRDGSIRMGGEIIGYMEDVNPKKETPDR
jgi:hypothetical protein